VFSGKNVLITGGSRGIGRAIALKMASLGGNIVINYTRNEEAARQTAKEIEALGGKAMLVQCDVGSYQQVDAMIQQIRESIGDVDILINNAGITRDNLLMRMSEADWDDVINTNLKGVYNCTKAVIRPMMKNRYGKIINVSSVVGLTGNVGQSNYAAAKAGIIGFTKAMAKELAPRKINVNAVAPGFITTDMTEVLPEELKNKILSNIPMNQFGTPEDVAEAVAFLASERARYITGQVIHIDGGMVM